MSIYKPKINLKTCNVFWISDIHAFHDNVIHHDNRPFQDVEEMHETIISNWNSVVSPNDVVFYLGDISLGKFDSDVEELIKKLNGNIYLILGNHDKEKRIREKYSHLFVDISNYKEATIINGNEKQHVIMFHYPILSWNGQGKGSWHLHGHCHGNLMSASIGEIFYKGKVMDVGCNVINYTPLSFFQIKNHMDKKDSVAFDHH